MTIALDKNSRVFPEELRNSVLLIDASVYIFRAYFAFPDRFFTKEGRPVNAVYGFLLFILDAISQSNPAYVAVTFDQSLGTCFRNRLYPAYKSSRAEADDDLAFQMECCRKACKIMGLSIFSGKRYEADDYLGSLGELFKGHKRSVLYVTRDKDIAQLLRPGDYIWDYGGAKLFSQQDMEAKLGVTTEQIPDLLAIAGDSIDDIPGVPGVGLKTAQSLLGHYKSLEDILNNFRSVADLPLRGAARASRLMDEHRDQAILSRQLAAIKRDIKLKCSVQDLKWQQSSNTSSNTDYEKFFRFLNKINLHHRMYKRLNTFYGLEQD